ncbi:MAG TPA: serine/threonine-protein kinase [Planctomycetaceae bacterium]|nr:serine/threonine-protein kinase [Planctomycetaceae bacterium]
MSPTELRGPSLDDTAQVWSILAGQVERFLNVWETGNSPPDLAAFLPTAAPAVRRMTLIELIKVDLEYRWQSRRPRPLTDYVREFPELADDLPPDLVYEEFHIRKQAGEAVDVEEYLARFPQQARELERLFGWQGAADVSTALFSGRSSTAGLNLKAGERIDDFDLLARLGQGAFASVFLARQNSMQRLVALKVSADRGVEPQTLAQLDHDQIVRVYDQRLLPDQGLRLMYMQYVAGGTLQQVVEAVRSFPAAERSGRLLFAAIDASLADRGESRPAEAPLRTRFASTPWPEVVCWIGARLARGLDYAHRQGVLHRDIKPANVLLAADGSPKLADFNISFSSKLEGATPAAYFGGSLAYMSPEQLEACNPAHEREADSLDGRSDLYSLGVLLWELLTGSRPFTDEQVGTGWSATLGEMAVRRRAGVDRERLALLARHWPPGLDQILLRCLEPETAARYSHGAELARQLEICLQPKASQLLSPAARDWRRVVRGRGMLFVMLAAVVPNLVAAVFNYFYNRLQIVDNLPSANAQDVFWRTQMIINAIAFPLGLGLAAAISRPVVAAVRRAETTAKQSAETLRWLRQRCLQLGHYAAGISLALWLVAAPAYPIAINLGTGAVPAVEYLHFVASLALCGLIAAAYPFFGVACLSVCSFYPALVRLETTTREDYESLLRLGRASWFYLLLAASVPMLSVAVLVLIGSQARFALALLAAGGVFGLATTFLLFRTLQTDLAALTLVTAPPGEQRDSMSESFGGM